MLVLPVSAGDGSNIHKMVLVYDRIGKIDLR